MLAVNDGGDQVAVHLLDASCQVVDVHTAAVDPYDPEDMALGADGTVWLADTGDNNVNRPTVALLALRTDGTTSVYRLSYPDAPHDAEALLLAPDGTPYLVTKEVLGASKVYRPASALVDGGTVALVEVASVNLTLTGTSGGPVGRAGQLMITGERCPATARTWLSGPTPTHTCGRSPGPTWPVLSRPPRSGSRCRSRRRARRSASRRTTSSSSSPARACRATSPWSRSRRPSWREAAPALGDVPSLTDLTRSGLSPITSAVIAALVATVVVWIVGLARRRP